LSRHTQRRKNRKIKWEREQELEQECKYKQEHKQNEISYKLNILINNFFIKPDILTDIVFNPLKVYFSLDYNFFKITK
jgi:hypothetical protein